MDVRKVTYDYRLNHWTEIVSECSKSGHTVKSWCKEHDIKPNCYYYWLKRIKIAACSSMCTVPEKTQQIVPINITDVSQNSLTEINQFTVESSQPAIILKMNSVVIEISNGATESIIQNTLIVINKLC
jgi:transposase-like protein